MKLLFVSSLERSGSTILDLKLSRYSNVLSLGEVWRVIKPHGSGLESVLARKCTCGQKAETCSFWSPVLQRLKQANETAGLDQRYAILMEVASERFGEEAVVVDSSKSIQALTALRALENVDIQVLHTIRDVRGWMESIRRAESRKREMPWGKIFESDFKDFRMSYLRHNILRSVPFWLPHEWLLRNQRLRKRVEQSGFERLDLSYEALVFDTEKVMLEIEKFANLKKDNIGVNSPKHEMHIIRGNRTAFMSAPDTPLYYSAHWMSRWKWSAMLGALPWVSEYNKRNVYYYL